MKRIFGALVTVLLVIADVAWSKALLTPAGAVTFGTQVARTYLGDTGLMLG